MTELKHMRIYSRQEFFVMEDYIKLMKNLLHGLFFIIVWGAEASHGYFTREKQWGIKERDD